MPKDHGLAWTTNPQSRHIADFHHTSFPDPAGIRSLWPGKARDMPNLQPGWQASGGPRSTPVSDVRPDGMVQVLLGVAYADGSLKLSPAGKLLRDAFDPPPNHARYMPVTAIDRPGAPGVQELAIPVPADSAAFRFLTGEEGRETQRMAASIWSNQARPGQLVHKPSLAHWMAMPEAPAAPQARLGGFLWRTNNDQRAFHIHLGEGASPPGAMRDLQEGWLPPGGEHPHDATVDSLTDASRLVYLGRVARAEGGRPVVQLSHAGERLRCMEAPDGLTHVPVLAIPDRRHPGTFDLALSVGPWELPLLTSPSPGDAATPEDLRRFWEHRHDPSNALRVESLGSWQHDPYSNGPRCDVRYAELPEAAKTLPREYQREPEFAAVLARAAASPKGSNASPGASPRTHSPGPG